MSFPYNNENDSFFVELDVARIYAQYMNAADSSFHGESQRTIISEYPVENENEIPSMWVFNYQDSGWLILSADYRSEPIMAFSANGCFTPDTIPGGLGIWFDASIERIDALRNGYYDNALNGIYAWKSTKVSNNITPHLTGKRNMPLDGEIEDPCIFPTRIVKGPLLQTTWGQHCTYNDLITTTCTTNCSHAPTGCVATAIAQVMHYFHKTSANFDYTIMTLRNGNNEVSRLMEDIGDNVNMSYGCQGSTATFYNYKNVLKNVYGYSNNDHGNYNLSTVLSNISNSKPVILGGCLNEVKKWWQYWKYKDLICHAWDCDGYVKFQYCDYSIIDLLHMNWGWHEVDPITLLPVRVNDFNGWYRYNNWTLPNNGNWNFQYYNDMVYNIQP